LRVTPNANVGKEILDVSEAEREAQVEPDGMPDDDRRKSVTAVGDPHNPISLLATSLPAHSVILKAEPRVRIGFSRSNRT
jgi:hypothetical protein